MCLKMNRLMVIVHCCKINDATKLIMTPHIAWAPVQTRNRVIDEVCLNIEGFKNNQLRNVCTL